MSHRDAEVSDIVVVLNQSFEGRTAEACSLLCGAGLQVIETDEDANVVEGSIETYKLPELHKLDCVNYVRTVLTYIADYPVGDPRNIDVTDDDDEEEDAA
jgi:hypothetical protein